MDQLEQSENFSDQRQRQAQAKELVGTSRDSARMLKTTMDVQLLKTNGQYMHESMFLWCLSFFKLPGPKNFDPGGIKIVIVILCSSIEQFTMSDC